MPESSSERIVIVSPHRDDAVLSCWSLIVSEHDVRVINVFTGGPAPGIKVPWDSDTDAVDSATRMLQRGEEDRAALGIAGREPLDLGLVEAMYGGGQVSPDVLRPHLRDAKSIYAPAGLALNPEYVNGEHAVVRDAVLALRPDARLYADQPYCGFRPDIELPPGLAIGLVPAVVSLSESQRRQKADAIRCYAGELPKLERIFRPFATPEQLGYEVLWLPA